MKTVHNNIQPWLRKQHSEFVRGFLDGLYSHLPKSGIFNRQEYIDGYADGSQYKAELQGISIMCWIRG